MSNRVFNSRRGGKYAKTAPRTPNSLPKILWRLLYFGATVAAAAASIAVTADLLMYLGLHVGTPVQQVQASTVDVTIKDLYDSLVDSSLSDAQEGVLSVDKVFWLKDEDVEAPEPDQACYGETYDASSLQWLLDDAQKVLDGQDTLFTTDVDLMPGSRVRYYLDDTIFVIMWKEIRDGGVYTFSEVKISHPSQFRRYVAGGYYNTWERMKTTDMSTEVNAVFASSGDFFANRPYGIVVYDGEVKRFEPNRLDTMYIDDQGNLLFTRRGELKTEEEAQAFVDEHNIRFSITFGPVLIENGERCEPGSYVVGESYDPYPRAAIGQRDELHYIIANINAESSWRTTATLFRFADQMETIGCDKVYTLDGGQTTVLTINDVMINAVLFGYQRRISDIFYFATAIPDGE